jgi:hypothetical protein
VFEDSILPGVALGFGFSGGYIRAEKGGVAKVPEPCEGVLFNVGFDNSCGRHPVSKVWIRSFSTISFGKNIEENI